MFIHTLFICIFVGIVLFLKLLRSRISKRRIHRQAIHELNIMFHWFWDGTPEDELYAWYKVRAVLKQREGRPRQEKRALVDKKIGAIDKKAIQGDYSVNERGQLVATDSKTNLAEM